MRHSRWLTLALLILTMLLAVACGDDDDSDSGENGATATPAATAFPVTLEHKFGTTTIASKPERVIALGYMEQDPLLALGVKPIATRYWFGDAPYAVFPWAQDELGDAQPEVLTMTFGELDFESIAALQPDLISAVYSGITEEEYTTLSKIAPTIAQSDAYIDFGMPWQEGTVVIGRAVGEETRAIELVDSLKGRFQAVRDAHADWQGMSVAVVAPGRDAGGAIFGSGDLRSRVFIDLGFEVPLEFDEITGDSFYAEVSMERADLFDQDLVVVHQLSYYEGGEDALRADPLWNSLAAVKEGRAVYIEESLDKAYGFNSVLSMEYFLDGILPQVEAALGDGTVSTGGFPVTIEHQYGSTTIDEKPERVVSVGFKDHEFLLALGIRPVAVREWWGEKPFATWSWAEAALGDAEPLVLTGELDFEAIAALNPDLIVGFYSGISLDEYELLSQIAPTVAQPGSYVEYGMPWEEQLLATGLSVGLPGLAADLLDQTNAAFEEIRSEHPEFEDTYALIGGPGEDGGFWVYGIEDPRSRLLGNMGFAYPPKVAESAADEFYANFSGEQTHLLDEVDVLVWLVDTEEQLGSPPATTLFEQLPAVQARHVYWTSWESDMAGALSFTSPLSLPWAVEQLAPELSAFLEE